MKICKLLVTVVLCTGLMACGEKAPKSRAVYMLIDTSGTYTRELNKAQKIGNYLLGTLNSGEGTPGLNGGPIVTSTAIIVLSGER